MWAEEGKHKHLPHVMPPAATGIRTTKYIIVRLLINTRQVSSYMLRALVHILIDKTLFAFPIIPVICNNHRIGAYYVLDVLLLVHRAKLKPNPLPNLTFLYIRAIFRG